MRTFQCTYTTALTNEVFIDISPDLLSDIQSQRINEEDISSGSYDDDNDGAVMHAKVKERE